MLRFGYFLLCAGAVVCLSACGKSDEPNVEAKNNAQQEVQIAPRQPQRPAAPAAPKKADDKPSVENSAQPQQDENAIDPATDPRDIFWVAGNAFEFDIAGQEPAVREDDMFSVVLPPASDFVRYDPVVPRHEDAAAPANKVTLPVGFLAIASEGFAESGWPWRIRCEKDRSVMAFVPAGTTLIGKEGGPAEAAPQLSVYLNNYYIDTTEVTLEQYELFRQGIKADRGRTMREALNATSPPDHPALGVAWTEIFSYANWSGKDLPNEAEWEKAARGEKGYEHPWGSDRAVWERSRTFEQIDPVKSFRTDVSLYGVYDLAGNAREWCSDFFSPTTYTEAAATGPVVRHWKGPKRGKGPNIRVARGGGPNWEAWHRVGLDTQEKQPLMGFRCVLRLDSEETSRSKDTKR